MFLLNLPLTIIVCVCAWIWLPRDGQRDKTKKLGLDMVGIILVGLTVLTVMWPLITSHDALLSWKMVAFLAAGLVFGLLFLTWEHYRERNNYAVLLKKTLRKTTSFINGTLLGTFQLTSGLKWALGKASLP